jgi:colicin import membrane protein
VIGYVPTALKLADGKTRAGATEIVASLLLHAKPVPKAEDPVAAKPGEKADDKANTTATPAAPGKPSVNAEEKKEPAKTTEKKPERQKGTDQPQQPQPKKDAPRKEEPKRDGEKRPAPKGGGDAPRRK